MPTANPTLFSTITLALRWVAVVSGCVFAADAAVDGSVPSVVAVGLAVTVAVWWTLRAEPVDLYQDVGATLVLAVASVLTDPPLAFVPAIVVSLAVMVAGRSRPADPGPSVDAATHVASALGVPTPAEQVRASAVRIHAEERQRAIKANERVGEWLTFVQAGLDRHLSRRPDRELAVLRDDVRDSIREIEERTRQARARITPSSPLSSHAGRLLEWWSDHYGADVTLQVPDPDARLDPSIEQGLLTILTEAIDNVGRHGEAEHLTVRWSVSEGTGSLRVADDGRGFDTRSTRGPGLDAMARAADRIEAEITVDSTPGSGTVVAVRVHDRP
ncbi:MAG: sensor histidine kinase [Acidimicrobiales bacterium]